MGRDQNTVEKRLREMEKKRKQEEKRERKRRKKEESNTQFPAEQSAIDEN